MIKIIFSNHCNQTDILRKTGLATNKTSNNDDVSERSFRFQCLLLTVKRFNAVDL